MNILTSWNKRATQPDKLVELDYKNSLTNSLVFGWTNHFGISNVFNTYPTVTNVNKTTKANKRSWSFAGGAEGNSDLNFGTFTPTNRSHIDQATTWAFLATSNVLTETALACQTDNNNDRGWQIGYVNTGLGITFVGASGNLRSNISAAPNTNTLYTFVITFTGKIPDSNELAMYLDGVSYAPSSDPGPVGTPGTIVDPLYLGRRRFDTALSHNGDIMLAYIAQRAWSPAEVQSFHENPWQAYAAKTNITYSFPSSSSTGTGLGIYYLGF